MPTHLVEFVSKLAEAHRPEVTPLRWDGQAVYNVRCVACDGFVWRLWSPGRPLVECPLWAEAKARGFVVDVAELAPAPVVC